MDTWLAGCGMDVAGAWLLACGIDGVHTWLGIEGMGGWMSGALIH